MQEELKKHQKIAYQILFNALKNKNLAHAYLFTGEKGTPKKETAYLLVQSLVCENGIFACEVCDACHRITHDGYADLIYLDGHKTSIKKKDILDIQLRFSKTQLERKGKKVYILDGVENATMEALNCLLKFLEEPEGDIIAILICEHTDRLLETIVSRCQILPFYKNNTEQLEKELQAHMDGQEAYMIARIATNSKQAITIYESDEFQHALYLFNTFLNASVNDPMTAKVMLQTEGFAKSKRDDKAVLRYFLEMMILLCKDSFRLKNDELKRIWQKNGENVLKLNASKILKLAIETKDKITRSVNIALLVDQFLYEWEDYDGK